MQRSGEVAQQVTMFALDEMMLASDSAMKMAVCCDPSTIVAAQGNMALAWFGRLTSQAITLPTMAMCSQQTAL